MLQDAIGQIDRRVANAQPYSAQGFRITTPDVKVSADDVLEIVSKLVELASKQIDNEIDNP